jgi:RNA polymerase sigma-B factor
MATIDADLSDMPAQPVATSSPAVTKADRDIRDERVHSHLGLAHQLARRFSNRGESHDDLVQVASLALVRAAERFDPDRGVMFSTFAAASIIGELKRHFRDRGWAVRAPRRLQELVLEIGNATDRLGQELGRAPTVSELVKDIRASESDVLEALEAGQSYRSSSLDARDREGQSMAESIGSEDGGFAGVENHSALTKAMATLSPRDREIVQLRFVEGLTQSEIAARLGVSQMQISRLLAASLRRLRSNIEARDRTSTLSSH